MLVFMACTGTGHLQKGEHLYAGAKINIVKTGEKMGHEAPQNRPQKHRHPPAPEQKIALDAPKTLGL